MIYLIDDKKNRQQNDFGWSNEKLKSYNIVQPIYTLEDLILKSKQIFQDGNTVIYHESFLDNSTIAQDAAIKREKLIEFANNHPNFYLVIFSGSKLSRTQENNIAYLPVSLVYQNLEIFASAYSSGDKNLKYILYGENYEIEEILTNKLNEALLQIDNQPAKINQRNLFLRPDKNFIDNPIEETKTKILFNDVSDEKISQKVKEWMSEEEYDNIFIPLCFGKTLSDYNGLRLAVHIRCTETINQNKNIFIYGFVGIDYLFENDYFNILKTKNVRLTEFSKRAFELLANKPFYPLSIKELPNEMAKLKLDSPKNYEDSHSIANEWAIYRWANAIGAKDEAIEKIINNINHQLYFRYLTTIYPIQEIPKIEKNQLKIEYSGSPKVLYIDDEAEKGWYEIFAHILGDLNDLSIDYIGEDFKKNSKNHIISQSIEKINTDDIDLVILDFRLHPDDFNTNDINNVVGLRLLKKIKKINPGIQIIVFSATNKVWNLQALLKAGADGFIVKESPENSIESYFTTEVVNSFISSLTYALKRRFLIHFFNYCHKIENNLNNIEAIDDTEYHFFVNELMSQFKLIKESGKMINLDVSSTLDVVFLNSYNFLERYKNYYVNEENYQFILGIEQIEMNRYSFERNTNKVINEGKFLRNNKNDKPTWLHSMISLFVDYFSTCNLEDPILRKLNDLKNKRNNYIHGKKSKFNQKELLMILMIIEKITSEMKE